MTSTAVDEGAEMLDVGGESRSRVDTSRPEVMREAVAAGAVIINDVRALRLPSALDTAAALAVPVCLMHMEGDPATMQIAPTYDDVVAEVHRLLLAQSSDAVLPAFRARTSCSTRASGS